MPVNDVRYNELRGALLNMEAVVEATPVTDPSFVALLRVYQETRGVFLRYANEHFDKMAEQMKSLAGQLEADLNQIRNSADSEDIIAGVVGIGKAVAGIVATGGLGTVLTGLMA